jgi:5-methylcytosine-specific restriction endonuclease McrA
MCQSNIVLKFCNKHNCAYTQRGNANRMHCRQCYNERNNERRKVNPLNENAREKKREIDRIYQAKKRLENPGVLKLAHEKYKQNDKYKERINYYKLKNKEGQYSNIYCIECNDVRLYGDKLCSNCKLIKKYIDTYNYTSVCKNCNKEFGVDVKLNNIGVIARFNQYCSEKCIKDLIVKNKKLYRRKRRITYGRIEKDKEIAEHFGIKYEFIQRRIVYIKHKYICTSCGVNCVHPNKNNYNESNAATLDHIIPKSKGGSHTYDNVTLLCRSCNTMKSDKLLNDYKKNIGQMEIEFTSYIPQGSQLQLQFQ